MKLIADILFWLRGRDDRTIIDQQAARREAERRLQADRDFGRELDLEQRRTSMQVGAWARETVTARRKATFPSNMRRQFPLWLRGLSGQELINLSKSSREEIRRHVFHGELIPGVRAVQPLDAQDPIFPKPVPPPDILNDRSAGGRRMKQSESASSSELGGSGWHR